MAAFSANRDEYDVMDGSMYMSPAGKGQGQLELHLRARREQGQEGGVYKAYAVGSRGRGHRGSWQACE